MAHAHLHDRIGEIAARVLPFGPADPELLEADANAAAGCSSCARALVNAREVAVELALAERPGVPRAPLARRVLESARRVRLGNKPSAAREPLPPIDLKATRGLDASAAVAHLHIGAPGDAERTAEVDALAAGTPVEGEATPRILAQIGRILRFPILFVSIVRGERVGYRVQRGLDPKLSAFREMRREMTYCTHCVSVGAPFIVNNAGAEPFFRGSKLVHRYLVNAYVGVPLRTSRGVTIGTLCALDFDARAIGPEAVRTLELFTRPVLAVIEHVRDPSARAAFFEDSPRGGWLYRADWFRSLCEVELAHVRGAGDTGGADGASRSDRDQPGNPASTRRSSALVAVRGPASVAVPSLAREDEPVGRLADDAVALLLPGADAEAAEARCAELRASVAALGLAGDTGLALALADVPDAAAFAARALRHARSR